MEEKTNREKIQSDYSKKSLYIQSSTKVKIRKIHNKLIHWFKLFWLWFLPALSTGLIVIAVFTPILMIYMFFIAEDVRKSILSISLKGIPTIILIYFIIYYLGKSLQLLTMDERFEEMDKQERKGIK
jgi:hypothetical protein